MRPLAEALATYIAYVGPLPRVDPLQCVWKCEAWLKPLPLLARVGFLPRVHPLVGAEPRAPAERLPALLALEGLLAHCGLS